jgi:uncharacterized protein (TIGR03579 family)
MAIDSTTTRPEKLQPWQGGFWLSEIAFPVFIAALCAGVFAGTHMFYVYGTGVFNEIAIAALLQQGFDGNGYGAAAAFGAGFMLARIIEGPMVGILDIGGSIQTGVGIGIPAMLMSVGITAPLENFWLALAVGAIIGLGMGSLILAIRKATVASDGAISTFGADVMMGAGNAAGRYLGILSAGIASLPVGIGSLIGAGLFYWWKKPLAGGAILGAMAAGAFFPIETPTE